MSPRRGEPTPRSARAARRRIVTGAAIVLFLIADVVLVAWAVNANRPDDAPGAVPQTEFSRLPTQATAPAPTPTPTEAPVVAAPRLLSVTDAQNAWRSTEGACPDPAASVEVTLDRGVTWNPVSVPGAGRILGLEAVDADQVRVVSAAFDSGCAVVLAESFTGGQFFERYPSRLDDAIYRDATDPTIVHAAGPDLTAPCPVLQIAVRPPATGVVCADLLAETTAGGAGWDQLALPGLLSAAPVEGGYLVAVGGAADCAGIAVERVSAPLAQSAATRLACVAEEAPTGVTLASNGADVWLWSGSTIRVSGDGGATWS